MKPNSEANKYPPNCYPDPPKPKPTPCGYLPGPIKASDGTRYVVAESGQIRRLERKMSKAEQKRHRKTRRARGGHEANR